MVNRSFKQETRFIVFTDLDATLLDKHSYDWAHATPALKMLENKGAQLVLSSSKTFSELCYFAKKLGNLSTEQNVPDKKLRGTIKKFVTVLM